MAGKFENKKVKINTERIRERVSPLSSKFSDFIETNKNKVFTAKVDIEKGYTKMYILEEDESEVKWLFEENDLLLA